MPVISMSHLVGVKQPWPVTPLPKFLDDELDLSQIIDFPGTPSRLYLSKEMGPHRVLSRVTIRSA